MTLYGLGVFAAVYALAVATPGPAVAAVVARSLARGTRGSPAFIAGFLIGDLTWFTFAATGLAALAKTAYVAFVVVKYVGVAYLFYLSYRMWTAASKPSESEQVVDSSDSSIRLLLGSLALTLGNPKVMVFFLALLPSVVRLQTLTVSGFLEIAAVICVALPAVLGSYAYAAARARRLLRSHRAVRVLNRASATAIAGAAVAVATQ